MTIDEAVQRVPHGEGAFVVWRSDTNEIIAAYSAPSDDYPSYSNSAQLAEARQQSALPDEVETFGRYFKADEPLRAKLEERQQRYEGLQACISELRAWEMRPAAELVAVFESGRLPPLLKGFTGESELLELFDVHAPEFNWWLRQRLWRVIKRSNTWHRRIVLRQLAFRLWHLQGDRSAIVRQMERNRLAFGRHWYGSVETMGRIRIAEPSIVRELTEVVRSDMYTFSAEKCAALTALARIGPAARADLRVDAARTIREVVYDSHARIVKYRERVLHRLESGPHEWTPCSSCHDGRIWHVAVQYPWCSSGDCRNCYGVGFVPVS